MRRWFYVCFVTLLSIGLCACTSTGSTTDRTVSAQAEMGNAASTAETGIDDEEAAEMTLKMKIGDTTVQVEWEKNESAEALKKLCAYEPLTIKMSMYGGFEQVGSIGSRLPSNDRQTTTSAGDIVLYSGNQMVVFYGSNSWAYTRLGYITDKTAEEMAELLGNGDVVITVSNE